MLAWKKYSRCFFIGLICLGEGGVVAAAANKIEQGEKTSDIATRLEYARVLSYMKKYDESIAEYQKILQQQPDYPGVRLELAKVYYYQGDYPAALDLLHQQEDRNEMAPEAQLLEAEIYMIQKDYAHAEELFRKNIDKIADPKEKDKLLFKVAQILSWEKKYDGSLEIYRDLLKRNPNDIQLRRNYAMVLLWAGKDKEAAAELKATLDHKQ